MSEISIAGLDKAELLTALYNGSQQFGAGFIHASGRLDMTVERARKIIDGSDSDGLLPWEAKDALRLRFDYVHGRVLKVDLTGDTLRTDLYNRDLGEGAAERIVAQLCERKSAAA